MGKTTGDEYKIAPEELTIGTDQAEISQEPSAYVFRKRENGKLYQYWYSDKEFRARVGALKDDSSTAIRTWASPNTGEYSVREDPEVNALSKIILALQSLDDEARKRVLKYIEGRFSEEIE